MRTNFRLRLIKLETKAHKKAFKVRISDDPNVITNSDELVIVLKSRDNR